MASPPESAHVLVEAALVHIHADTHALHKLLKRGSHGNDPDGTDDRGVTCDDLVGGAADVVSAGRAQSSDAGDHRLLLRDLQHTAVEVVGRRHAAAWRVYVQHEGADVVVLCDGGENLLVGGRLYLPADAAEQLYHGDPVAEVPRGSEY